MFFSGFCLSNEEILFDRFYEKNDFVVAGFSKGAIEAVEYVLSSDKRVDKLLLLSPAFFNDKDEKFKRLQMISFKKDRKKYISSFLEKSGLKSIDFEKFLIAPHEDDLKFLLNYSWSAKKLQMIKNRGIKIETFLGGLDKIINPLKAKEFFKQFGVVYFFKNYNHILI